MNVQQRQSVPSVCGQCYLRQIALPAMRSTLNYNRFSAFPFSYENVLFLSKSIFTCLHEYHRELIVKETETKPTLTAISMCPEYHVHHVQETYKSVKFSNKKIRNLDINFTHQTETTVQYPKYTLLWCDIIYCFFKFEQKQYC